MSHQDPDNWISAELKRVPLPEGLLERLRAVAQEPDEELDARLRDVAVPAGLVGRLKEIVADDALDRQLADLPVPANLLSDLRQVPEDELLDEAIRDVPIPVPAHVHRKLMGIPVRGRRWRALWHLATAVSLLLTISFSYFLTMLGLMADAYRPPEKDVIVIAFGDTGVDLLAVPPDDLDLVVEIPAEPRVRRAADVPQPSVELVAFRLNDSPDIFEEFRDIYGDRYGPLDDARLIDWEPLGSPHRADDELPEIQAVPPVRSGGMPPPLDRGYDRKFLRLHGVHPVVAPAAGGGLAAQTVPLTASTDSFDRAERMVAQGRMPEAEDIRVEEFLAATNDQLPLPSPGELAIRAAAGPSVFGAPGAQLLQVSVQAGQPARRVAEPAYVTVLVDVSASMRWGGRLDNTRRALRRFFRHLDEGDRVSLVRFHEEAYLDKEFKGLRQMDELLTAVEWLRPRGGTNIGAGLQLAASVATRYPLEANVVPKLAIVSDGMTGLAEADVVAMERFLEQLGGQGVELCIVDLSDGVTEHPLLARLAAAAGGDIVKAASAEEIQWVLVEALAGGSSLVASDAVFKVQFNPRAVSAYRLIGHSPAMAGLMPRGPETPLRCRQAGTALFEVWLKPDGGDDVATASVEWRDPVSGEPRRCRQRISLLQFAPSLAEAPLSLQSAAIVAETAEVLGESPYATGSGLRDVIVAAREVHPRLAERLSFQRFVSFVEQLERTRTRRAGAGR